MIATNTLWTAVLNHLWQSTLFAAAAIGLAVGLRSASAATRYRILLAGSLKFLLPLSLLVALGTHLHWQAVKMVVRPEVTATVSHIQAPFHQPAETVSIFEVHTSGKNDVLLFAVCVVWFAGCGTVFLVWLRRWYGVYRLTLTEVKASAVGALRTLSLSTLSEPAVFGIFRPVLLLPKDIESHLTPAQLAAVWAHELGHIRRRDNLTAAFHMVVEAVFWFHPMVWRIGRKLLTERELACDEAVVAAGNDPQMYAEAVIQICKVCLASPLACISGVGGADLKRRIETIMSRSSVGDLKLPAKLLLALCALTAGAAPFAIGLAQAKAEFDVASIKPSKAANGLMSIHSGPDGRYVAEGITTQMLIVNAYNVHAFQVENLPSGIAFNHYDIEARAAADAEASSQDSSFEKLRSRREEELQNLLVDRFQLKLHHETKELPVYALVIGKNGSKLKAAANPNDPKSRGMRTRPGELDAQGISPDMLAANLSNLVGRVVTDRTGLTGRYDLTLRWTPEQNSSKMLPNGEIPATTALEPSEENGPSIFTALEEQLGLKLVPGKAPVDILVVDHIEKPSAN